MWTPKPTGYHPSPRTSALPTHSTSSCRLEKTSLSNGCWSPHTAAATAPHTAPRSVRVRSRPGLTSPTVTRGPKTGTPCAMNHAHDRLHKRAREKGANPIVYGIVRAVFQPFFHIYFRMSRIGREHIPRSGPVIVAASHRSFLDHFVLAAMARRP